MWSARNVKLVEQLHSCIDVVTICRLQGKYVSGKGGKRCIFPPINPRGPNISILMPDYHKPSLNSFRYSMFSCEFSSTIDFLNL